MERIRRDKKTIKKEIKGIKDMLKKSVKNG